MCGSSDVRSGGGGGGGRGDHEVAQKMGRRIMLEEENSFLFRVNWSRILIPSSKKKLVFPHAAPQET